MLTTSPIPLYYQVANVLRHRILDGDYTPGQRIGTEFEMCGEFEVSRITIRQALNELERDHLVVRRPRLGTFVSDQVPQKASMTFTGYLEDLFAQVRQIGSREARLEQTVADDEVARELQLGDDRRVVRIERVRVLDGAPLSHTIDYLPLEIGASFSDEDVHQHAVMHLLEHRAGMRIDQALQTIRAVVADRELAGKLSIREGAPLLQVKRTFYGGERPLEYVTIHYRADRYEYTARLTRVSRSTE